MDLTPLGEGCGVDSPEPATTGSGVFGIPLRSKNDLNFKTPREKGSSRYPHRSRSDKPNRKMHLTHIRRTAMLTS